MNLALNEAEKSAIFAELKTDYLYIALPFFVLVLIKTFYRNLARYFSKPQIGHLLHASSSGKAHPKYLDLSLQLKLK